MNRSKLLWAAASVVFFCGVATFVLLARGTSEAGSKKAPKNSQDVASSAGVTRKQLPAPPRRFAGTTPSGAIPLRVDGQDRSGLGGELLAGLEPEFTAPGRRAWRLRDLLGGEYMRSDVRVLAETEDGRMLSVRSDNPDEDLAILVQRDDETQYIAWLQPNWKDHKNRLADAEKPGERIESVRSVSIEAIPEAPPVVPGQFRITRDGKTLSSLDSTWVSENGKEVVVNRRRGNTPAANVLALVRASDAAAQISQIYLTGGDTTVALKDGPGDARPLLFVTRRLQLKFAWVGSDNTPIDGTILRKVSEIAVRRP